ncbi:DUF7426 family protein [Streptomyces sp. NPDC055078]
MAARFEALTDALDEGLELPVTGRDGVERIYRIPEPSAEDGIRVEKVMSLAARLAAGGTAPDAQVLDDDEEIDLYRACLGSAYDQLLAEVSWSRFKHCSLTCMFWITQDKQTAQQYWVSGGDPSRMAPNRAARRQQQRPGSSESGTATSTRSRGSTNGTRADSPPRRRRRRG